MRVLFAVNNDQSDLNKRLNMENLIDRYYTEKGGYPMPGINGRLAYRYDF